MSFQTISFRIPKSKKTELDAIAASMDRDRSYVLNQAVAEYIELHRRQTERIKEGVAAAEAGDFATEDDLAAARAKWRR